MSMPVIGEEVSVLALLERRLDGDDALLRLSALRLEQSGLGAEVHAETPEQLEEMLAFRPRVASPVAVHLPRGLDILREEPRRVIGMMARAGEGTASLLVVHDQHAAVAEPKAYHEALRRVNADLDELECPPAACIEYASGMEPSRYLAMMERASTLKHICACVDIGHVGIAEARRYFERRHPGRDVCTLNPSDPRLPSLMDDVQSAGAYGREAAQRLTGEVARLGKTFHMHLHDGHPLSIASPWGVSDHLSFLDTIPLPFEFDGRWGVETMFGPSGLAEVLEAAVSAGRGRVSMTLEIHPTLERRPLGDAQRLFAHWKDRTNAEITNHWLHVLQCNHRLLRAILAWPRYPSAPKESHSSRHSEHLSTP